MTLRSAAARILGSAPAIVASASYGRGGALYGREKDRARQPAPSVAVAGRFTPLRSTPQARRIAVGDSAASSLVLSPGALQSVARAVSPGRNGGMNLAGAPAFHTSFTPEEVAHVLGAKALKDALPPDVYLSLESNAAVPILVGVPTTITLTNNTRDVNILNALTDDLMLGWYLSFWTIGLEVNRIQQGEISAQAWAMKLNHQLSQPKGKLFQRQDVITAIIVNRTGAPGFFRMGFDCRYVNPPCAGE